MAEAKSRRKKAKPAARKRRILVASARIKAAAKKSAARAARGAPIRSAAAGKSRRKALAPGAADKITLHGSVRSIPACKIAVMLSMCGGKWDFRNIDGDRRRTPEYQALSRFGQIPVLQHGDRTICQSNAILRHL